MAELARAIAIADRRALGATLDHDRNSALCEAILQGAQLEVYATSDGSVLSLDPNGIARLSDPATPDAARVLAAAIRDRPLALARGPVDAAAAFVAELAGSWTKIFDGIEMAWLARPELRTVAGELRCSSELARSFDDWRAAFIAEVFRDGGTPPEVAPDQLFVWTSPAGPHAMAGLLPQGPTGARIVTVYTPPNERGRGYAAALTAALGEHARREGRGVTLDVSVDDPWARRAYERAGFRAVGSGSAYSRN
jgi:ribosomal protein S18 acetylase RimI-like enzyme